MTDNTKAINDAVCKVLTERTDITYIPCLSYPIATALDALGYRIPRPEAEIKAEAIREFVDMWEVSYDKEKYKPGFSNKALVGRIATEYTKYLDAQEDAK